MLKIFSIVFVVTAIGLMSEETVQAAGRRCGGCGGGRGRAVVPSHDAMIPLPSTGHEEHSTQMAPDAPLQSNTEVRRSYSYDPIVPAPVISSPAHQRLRSRTPTYVLPNADPRKHNGGF